MGKINENSGLFYECIRYFDGTKYFVIYTHDLSYMLLKFFSYILRNFLKIQNLICKFTKKIRMITKGFRTYYESFFVHITKFSKSTKSYL